MMLVEAFANAVVYRGRRYYRQVGTTIPESKEFINQLAYLMSKASSLFQKEKCSSCNHYIECNVDGFKISPTVVIATEDASDKHLCEMLKRDGRAVDVVALTEVECRITWETITRLPGIRHEENVFVDGSFIQRLYIVGLHSGDIEFYHR